MENFKKSKKLIRFYCEVTEKKLVHNKKHGKVIQSKKEALLSLT